MGYSSTSGTSGDTFSDPNVSGTGITSSQLSAIYAALGATDATVVVTGGDQDINITGPNTAALVEDTSEIQSDITAVNADAAGGLGLSYDSATFVTNNTTSPTYVYGTGKAAFVEYHGSGPATIDGGTTAKFVVDAETSTGNLVIDASSAAGSYSWLIGGSAPGSDTINGSTSATASTVVTAKSAPTIINANNGAATMYGGGATTMIGGNHSGQLMSDSNANAADSMQAGSAGQDVMAVSHGTNTLDDTAGNGTDTLYGGDGSDTMLGSSAGSNMNLSTGLFDIVSKGADTISVSGSNTGTDTISGPTATNVSDFVHFASAVESATQLQTELNNAPTLNGVKTISFATTGASPVQTVQFTNATHITFT